MDKRIPARGSASRSSSVSSVSSCMSVASSTASDLDGENGSGAFIDEDSLISNSTAFDLAVGPDMESEERKAAEAGEWIGRPRLCDFGMSVRIPKSLGKGAFSFFVSAIRFHVCLSYQLFMLSIQPIDSSTPSVHPDISSGNNTSIVVCFYPFFLRLCRRLLSACFEYRRC